MSRNNKDKQRRPSLLPSPAGLGEGGPIKDLLDPTWTQLLNELPEDLSQQTSHTETDQDSMLKNQIDELRAYIDKLEEDKKQLQSAASKGQLPAAAGETAAQNCKCSKDNAIFALIKENIEKVRLVQEKEKERLAQEKQAQETEANGLLVEKNKLATAKADLKTTLDRGMGMLEAQRIKMETEFREKEGGSAAQLAILQQRLVDIEEERKREAEREREEEKRHIKSELEELMIRREMTTKALDSEARIEELESLLESSSSELNKLKSKFRTLKADLGKAQTDNLRLKASSAQKSGLPWAQDADFKVFVQDKSTFDENSKLRCVFCPGENLIPVTGFIFHVAREHMFDQYKQVDTISPGLQVGMLLKVLEERARKDSSREIREMKTTLTELTDQAEKFEDIKEEKNRAALVMQEKLLRLEQDIESLLSVKSNQAEEIAGLVTRNNTLINQANSANANLVETIKTENNKLKSRLKEVLHQSAETKAKLEAVERERNVMKQRWNTECGEKMGLKNKIKELLVEKEVLQRRLNDRDRTFNESSMRTRNELRNTQDDRNSLRRKVEELERKMLNAANEKNGLESKISSLKTENAAIKEFRSDLSAINDILIEDTRTENKNLSARLKAAMQEKIEIESRVSNLQTKLDKGQTELAAVGEERDSYRGQLLEKQAETENLAAQIQTLQVRIDELEKGRLEFSNFDLGLDSLLRAPLDDINLQIDSIDILNNRNEADQHETIMDDSEKISSTLDNAMDDLLMDSVDDNRFAETAENLRIFQNNTNAQEVEFLGHGVGCDCVECDEVDYLHGFVQGRPYGIREMMENLRSNVPTTADEFSDDDQDDDEDIHDESFDVQVIEDEDYQDPPENKVTGDQNQIEEDQDQIKVDTNRIESKKQTKAKNELKADDGEDLLDSDSDDREVIIEDQQSSVQLLNSANKEDQQSSVHLLNSANEEDQTAHQNKSDLNKLSIKDQFKMIEDQLRGMEDQDEMEDQDD